MIPSYICTFTQECSGSQMGREQCEHSRGQNLGEVATAIHLSRPSSVSRK